MNNVHVRRVAPPERRNSAIGSGNEPTRSTVAAPESFFSPRGVWTIGRLPSELVTRLNGCESSSIGSTKAGRTGLPGILTFTARGPRSFTADIVEQIAEVALSPPKELIGMTQWSLAKLREYMIEQGLLGRISLEWLRQLLRCRGVRWRRTKTWKESTDPEFWPKYRQIRRLYGARPRGGRRLCVDEFGPLNLQPRHGHCLAGRNKRVERLRATYNRPGGVRNFFACYNLIVRFWNPMQEPVPPAASYLGCRGRNVFDQLHQSDSHSFLSSSSSDGVNEWVGNSRLSASRSMEAK